MAVLEQRVRGLILALAVAGCGAAADPDEAPRYLDDAAFRRATLESSLLAPETPYARLRLQRYERAWAALPAWNPPSAPVNSDGTRETPAPLAIPEASRRGDLAALRDLGERAFWTYPAQLAPSAVGGAPGDVDTLARHGFLVDRGAVVGLRRVTLPAGGGEALAFTCATCHAARDAAGAVVPGVANASLDIGRLSSMNAEAEAVAARLRAWGVGRVDVSTADAREPVAMPDLRAVRYQRTLHRAGAVANRSLAALAVRVETLLVTSLREAVRPPREVALGLAVYLRSLGDGLGPAPSTGEAPGGAVFARACARCHVPGDYAGGNIPADEVGTERAIADSVERGTGAYRAPSLRGVATRGPLLHDGAARDLDALLDPARVRPDYAASRRGPGPIVGHPFGLDLSAADRAALLDFLRRL